MKNVLKTTSILCVVCDRHNFNSKTYVYAFNSVKFVFKLMTISFVPTHIPISFPLKFNLNEMYRMKKVSVQVHVFGKSSLFVPFKAGSGVWSRVECQVVKFRTRDGVSSVSQASTWGLLGGFGF